MTVASRVANVARQFGVDIRRVNLITSPFLRLVQALNSRSVRTVLDVGANDGGFASDLIGAGYAGRIISFEPLPDAWDALRARTRRHAQTWEVGPRVALSDQNGEAAFHEAGNSVSSSLLEMAKLHEDASPGSAIARSITVEIRRLDDLIEPLGIAPGERVLLKIDVQGAEPLVLAGARRSLEERIVGIKLEMSLAPLYQGQSLWLELHEFLEGLGFRLWDMDPGFRDSRTGRLLQFDGLYFRDVTA